MTVKTLTSMSDSVTWNSFVLYNIKSVGKYIYLRFAHKNVTESHTKDSFRVQGMKTSLSISL